MMVQQGRNFSSSPQVWVFLALLGVGMIAALVFGRGRLNSDKRVEEANQSYLAAEGTQVLFERKAGFNHALDLYLSLDKDYQPRYGNGKLDYNIGNTFFQVEEYPLAILYYRRALALMPREEGVKHNLDLTLAKVGLPKDPAVNAFAPIFFFHFYLSLPERLQLFLVFSILALFFASATIWVGDNTWFRKGRLLSLILASIMLLSVGYTRYLAPVEAVIIKAVDLRRDAGLRYAKVGQRPLPGGSAVEVLEVATQGDWLKIGTPQGDFGYVPQETVHLIGP